MTKQEINFLRESNAIERVYDEDSLVQAKKAWQYLLKKEKITPAVILHTHKILMKNQPIESWFKGNYRNCPVYIGRREGLKCEKIADAIKQWCVNANDVVINGKKESKIFLEKIMKTHHVKYEEIHPFIDGNGRTGRLFMNWERVKTGLSILVIHEGHEQMDYYKWFK